MVIFMSFLICVLALCLAPYVLSSVPLDVLCTGRLWLSGHVTAFITCVHGSILPL